MSCAEIGGISTTPILNPMRHAMLVSRLYRGVLNAGSLLLRSGPLDFGATVKDWILGGSS
jgi:hypothetical protein